MSALRVASLLKNVKLPVRSFVRLSHDDHHEADQLTPAEAKYWRSTLNDMPVPSGCWQEAYDEKNRKLNLMLGAVCIVLAGTAYFNIMHTKTLYTHSIGDVTKIEIHP